MDTPPDDQKMLGIKIAIHGLFALVGGVVREITHGKTPSLLRYVCGGFVGMFAGIIVYCICRHLNVGEWATAALTAVGGYAGDPLLDKGANWLKRRVEKEK